MTSWRLARKNNTIRDRMHVRRYKEYAMDYFTEHGYTRIGTLYLHDFLVTAELVGLKPYQLDYLYNAYWHPLHGDDDELRDFVAYAGKRYIHDVEWDDVRSRSSTPRLAKRVFIGLLLWKDHRFYVARDRHVYGDM